MKAKLKLFLFLLLVLTLLYGSSRVLNVGYRKLYQPTYETLSRIFEDTQSFNTLLIGNSKVEFGINPFYIDRIAQLNTINFGYAATNFPTHLLLLQAYLKKHPAPKYLLLGIENNMFFTDEDHCNKLPLYDYLNRQEVVEYFESLQLPYKLPKYIPFSKFVFMDDYSRFGILSAFRGKGLFQSADIYHYKGFYIGKKNRAPIPFIPQSTADTALTLHAKALATFEQIVSICKKQGITLLLLFPPRPHDKGKPIPISNRAVDQYLVKKQRNNSFLVLRNDSIASFEPTHFVDASHLNYEGSVKYSSLLGTYLFNLQQAKPQ
ncbi:MAG: hypothetical protein IPK62_15025 [Bacteroidetes bacterium]|nr:hypothetical protein [Bacteroidota bacterium]